MFKKTKKIAMLTLAIKLFSTQPIAAATDWNNIFSQENVNFVAGIGGVTTVVGGGIYGIISFWNSRTTQKQAVALGYLTNNEKHLSSINQQLELANKKPKENVNRIKILKAMADAFATFSKNGLTDKKDFTDTEEFLAMQKKLDEDQALADKKEAEKKAANSDKKPGIIGKTYEAIKSPFTLAQSATGAIADSLGINSTIDYVANQTWFKGGLLDQYRKGFGRSLVAATIAITSYKAYSWYTDEERILAAETVVELQEQAREIAEQFAQEMQKPTLSAEEKAKLQQAYTHYMQSLYEEIEQQKIIAGHGVYKKILAATIIAAGGVAGAIALAKHYPTASADASNPSATGTNTQVVPTPASTETPIITENLLKEWIANPDSFTGNINDVKRFILDIKGLQKNYTNKVKLNLARNFVGVYNRHQQATGQTTGVVTQEQSSDMIKWAKENKDGLEAFGVFVGVFAGIMTSIYTIPHLYTTIINTNLPI